MKPSAKPTVWILAALATLVASLVLAACQPLRPTGSAATPSPTPTLDPAADWQRIETDGKLVVGTSADYAPFESYDDNFKLDGFDIALVRAIGEKLGLEVIFRDMAFDGLGDALAMGHIDAVIAAVTVTPERAALVDFTDTYFVSTDAYLVKADASPQPLKTVDDLKGLRIGVERGSIYESWLQKNLVDAGLIESGDLVVYTNLDKAVTDVTNDRIDAVVLDLPVAQTYAKDGQVKVGGEGVWSQRYALAVRKGSDALRRELNRALMELQDAGVVAKLAEQYLGISADELLPIPTDVVTPAPIATPAPGACQAGMSWVADLSYDDHGMSAPPVMVPGQPFVKSWRLRNTGTCTWDSTYYLDFVRGNAPGASMSGQPTHIQGTVPPGATYDLSVNLRAPLSPGVYQGFWQLFNGKGKPFGDTIWVGIQVAGAPTPTPMPTQTPAPGITFYADSTNIRQGESATFYRSAQDAKAVYFYAKGENWQDNAVAATGSQTVYPLQTTTYNLRVVNNDGSVSLREITVNVEPVAGAPQISYYSVSPSGQIAVGQCVDIAWKVDGDVSKVAIFRNKEAIWDDAPVEGTTQDCPSAAGSYDYAVGAIGMSGQVVYDVRSVDVVEGAVTPAPAGPSIEVFSVTPDQVVVNGCVQIIWSVGGDVASVRILRGGVIVVDGAASSGAGSDCLTEMGAYTYRIEALGSNGEKAAAQSTVSVVPPTPTPPVGGGGSTDADLLDRQLALVSYQDTTGAQVSPLVGTQLTALFSADGTLSGSAGCNSYSAGYTAGNGAMTITPIATTQKFCAEPPGVMDQEAQYLSALQTTAGYQVSGRQLTLLNGAGQIVAIYTAKPVNGRASLLAPTTQGEQHDVAKTEPIPFLGDACHPGLAGQRLYGGHGFARCPGRRDRGGSRGARRRQQRRSHERGLSSARSAGACHCRRDGERLHAAAVCGPQDR